MHWHSVATLCVIILNLLLVESLRIPHSTLVISTSSVGSTSFASSTSTDPSRTATTTLGSITGRECVLYDDVTEFLGIPFARPPVGDLRFRPPVAYDTPYPEPAYQALSNPPACGSYSGAIGSLDFQAVDSSEDCLYMNLWTPSWAVGTNANLPVRVYIHGGHDLECSASDPYLNGCNYAHKTSSVIVNIQFRKGPFGYLAHPATMTESNTTGNWAILDQQLALKWIQGNIESFGGNPSQVLLNGNSAGGQYVDFQVVSHLSAGLFSAAISQSPPCVKLLTLNEAYNLTKTFMTAMNCPESDATTELECLRNVGWDYMFTTAEAISLSSGLIYAECESLSWISSFQAVLDGNVFHHPINVALESGAYNKVPYMVGYSAQEGTHFMDQQNVTATTFTDMLESSFPLANLSAIEALYPREIYFGINGDTEKARVSDLWTDLFFSCPIYERLNARQMNSTSANYLYKWAVTPSCPTDTTYLGASHGSEILFTYGIVQQINPPWGTCDFNEEEVAMSNLLINAWKSMSVVGEPQWLNGSAWETWSPQTQLGTLLRTGNPSTAVIDIERKCTVIQRTRQEAIDKMNQKK